MKQMDKPDTLSSITRTHRKVEGENQPHKIILWLHARCGLSSPTDTCSHTHNQKKCLESEAGSSCVAQASLQLKADFLSPVAKC